jgi:DNA-binding winged helix-turn-helix (wHTH) protein/Tfp pilus assembly protein PilF
MNVYEVGPFQLSAEQLLLMRDGAPVALGPKVVETLLALVEHPGEVLSKGFLLDRIWPDGFVEEANLAQNVHVLRKTFRHHGGADPIETVPRRGYRLTAAVRRRAELSRAPGTVEAAPRGQHALGRRIAAALVGAAFVAASLALAPSDGSGRRSATPPGLSDNGARLYGIGRYYWNLRSREGVRKSLDYFAQVIDTDPRNARGYAALADANLSMGDYCYGTHRPAVYFARAQEYATKAVALDPNSAEAHAAFGFVALYRKDVTAGMEQLQRAIALDPTYSPAQEWYGIALIGRGRMSEGVARLKLAAALDPLSVAAVAWLGKAAYQDRRYGDAIAYSQEALELSPQRTDVLATIGEAYAAQGDIERAIAAFKQFGAVDRYYRPQAAVLLTRAYALAHRSAEARAELAYARAHASEIDPLDLDAAAAAVTDPNGTSEWRVEQRGHHTSMYA